ncbi:hypothetical protein [Alienimonas chondri]|uniref:PepSY domain-containing protein n=1 Tax=Alienimonas chondri TaxID=2681879 RepID=A0ABX1VAP8_9PLAN|nr:hypothetical protein [Alienimonas chondri]NNJ24843.1 hypothetical protein [Alienimonas chondri]
MTRDDHARQTPARRFARLLGELLRPFAWMFAAIGAALIAFPAGPMWSAESDEDWTESRVQVSIDEGRYLFAWGGLAAGEPWSPHLRAVSVTVFGDPMDENAGPERQGDASHSGGSAIGGWIWIVAMMERGGVSTYPVTEDSARGTMHRTYDAAISLWPLALLFIAIAAVRWRRRVGRTPSTGASRFEAVCRVARPWIWSAAGIGAFVTVVQFLPVGPGYATASVNRGPVETRHPRVLEASIDWISPPPEWIDEGGTRTAAATGAGLWFSHERSTLPRIVSNPVWQGRTVVGLSLWWFAFVALLANGVTLWRMRRRGEPDADTARSS